MLLWACGAMKNNILWITGAEMSARQSDRTRKYRLRNKYIRSNLGVAPNENKMKRSRLKWFGHAYRDQHIEVRKSDGIQESIKRKRGNQFGQRQLEMS